MVFSPLDFSTSQMKQRSYSLMRCRKSDHVQTMPMLGIGCKVQVHCLPSVCWLFTPVRCKGYVCERDRVHLSLLQNWPDISEQLVCVVTSIPAFPEGCNATILRTQKRAMLVSFTLQEKAERVQYSKFTKSS